MIEVGFQLTRVGFASSAVSSCTPCMPNHQDILSLLIRGHNRNNMLPFIRHYTDKNRPRILTIITNILLELALLGKMIQRGSEGNANNVLTRDGDCSVNLASQGHCTGVFICA
jgi:hypothetical protein